MGALASAILVANNLRDIPTDREHGKRTLAVRMGESGTRAFYVALVAVAFVMTGLAALTSPWALLALLAAPLVVRPMQAVVGRRHRPRVSSRPWPAPASSSWRGRCCSPSVSPSGAPDRPASRPFR